MVDNLTKLIRRKQMKKLMSKVAITLAVLMGLTTTVYAKEKSISFYVGHGNGGISSAYQTTISQELTKKGWNVNFKIIGNCGQVKNLLETSNEPILAGWGADWNSVSTNVCYNPLKKAEFVTTFVVSPRLLCGPYNDLNFDLVKGNKYKIGLNQGQNHHVLLNALGKKLDVTFKVIEYKNSGSIKRAMQAKEIDAWYTTRGLVNHENKTQKCIYGTLDKDYSNIVALKKLLPTENVYASFVAYLMVNKNVQGDLKKQLDKDIISIVNSKAYQTALKSSGAFLNNNTLENQLELIESTAKAYKK
jgi:hypothetical protein